MKGVE